MRRLLLLLLLLLLPVLVLACGRPRGQAVECRDASGCDAEPGEFTTCIDGDCETVECLASSDCPIGSYCDSGDDYECIEGCQADGDCLAGESCNDDRLCVARGCRSTVLDCPHGQECNTDSGSCEPISGTHCDVCDATGLSYQWDTGGTFDQCDDTYVGHFTCGTGAFCLTDEAATGRCMPGCDPSVADSCAWGFTCNPITIDWQLLCGDNEPRVLGYACIPMTPCSEM
jgi:hypothetical protein